MRVVSLAQLNAMTLDERWKLIDTSATRAPRPAFENTCPPSYIGPLYTSTPFPHGTSIRLDADNVFNGRLTNDAPVEMRWTGYTCELYDGELKLCPVRDAVDPIIQGTCNGEPFCFHGSVLQYGTWPRFLYMYQSPPFESMDIFDAAKHGFLHRVQYLVEQEKVPVNAHKYGMTVLGSAVLGGHYYIVNYLIGAGADYNRHFPGYSGLYLDVACFHKSWSAVEALVDGGAKRVWTTYPKELEAIYARRAARRREARAAYFACLRGWRMPKDLVRLICKRVWETRFVYVF